ncbi:MAG: sugar transferase [Brevinematia bacterium]
MKFRIKYLIQLLFIIIVDVITYYLSLISAVFFDVNFKFLFNFYHILGENLKPFLFQLNYTLSIWWILVVHLASLQINKLYQIRYPFWEETKLLIKSASISSGFVLLAILIRNMYGEISRSLFIWWWFFLVIFLPLFRFWGKKLLFNLGIWKEKALIIGSGEKAILTITGLSKEKHLGYEIVGILDEEVKGRNPKLTIAGKTYKIYKQAKALDIFLKVMKIDTVFIAVQAMDSEKLTNLVNRVYKLVRRVIVIPDIKGIAIFNSELHYLFMEKLFMIKVNNNLNSFTNRLIKKTFDIVFSFVGLLVLLPFFLVIAILIKLTSKGPVFFKHKRIGKNGKEIYVYKFRTMYQDAEQRLKKLIKENPAAREEWEKNFKLKNDPRVTFIGKIMRKTSIDELPQIINVLKGEMSLVGPRPVIKEEIDNYYKEFKQYYYSVDPGMTGLWQVSGRSDTDYDFRVQTDVWYVQNWSMWLDLMILFRTVGVVLRREGAY